MDRKVLLETQSQGIVMQSALSVFPHKNSVQEPTFLYPLSFDP